MYTRFSVSVPLRCPTRGVYLFYGRLDTFITTVDNLYVYSIYTHTHAIQGDSKRM